MSHFLYLLSFSEPENLIKYGLNIQESYYIEIGGTELDVFKKNKENINLFNCSFVH